MSLDKERVTDSVINVVQHEKTYIDEFLNKMVRNFYQKIGSGNLVKAHKEAFGRQSYCWVGEYRYWVWDFWEWRVYVSNKKGVQLEVNIGTSPERTMQILREYWNKFGV